MIETYQGRDGKIVVIEEMSDKHLQNAIRFFDRCLASMYDALSYYPCFNGEMAQYHAEQQYDLCLEETSEIFQLLDSLKAEQIRRGSTKK